MKQKKQIYSILMYIALGIIVVWGFYQTKVDAGKPFPIQVDDVTIIPGETTMGDLLEQGVEMYASTSNPLDPASITGTEELEANTEAYMIYGIPKKLKTKVNDRAFYCTVVNTSDKVKEIKDCVVNSVSVDFDKMEELKCTLLINGKPYSEGMKSELESEHKKYFKDYDDSYAVQYDKYKLEFDSGDDGKISSVKSSWK